MTTHFMALALSIVTFAVNAQKYDGANKFRVSKVVALLKDMQAQLEKEAEADEEVYSKLACWCETNDKGKTKAIADAESRLATLGGTIEQMSAMSTTLHQEIDGLKKEIAKNEKSLEVATALREKQKAEFVAEEKEMVQSISALKSAIVVLSKHHGGSAAAFLNNKMLLKAFNTVRAQMEKHSVLLQGTITPSQRRTISSFVQTGAKQPTFKAYTPQSGQIFGILDQMRATFEADLSNSQKEEMESEAAYQDLKKAKEEQIATAQASLDEKSEALADTDQTLAQAKEDTQDTQAALDADTKFLAELKKKCAMTDKEWEERQKMRQTELEATAKAIAILSGDDARDTFSRTFSFMQVSTEHEDMRRAAAHALSKVASKSRELAALVDSVRLDPFTKVKKAIDDMIASLLKEKAEEIKHKDFCLEGFQKNEVATQKKDHTKVGLVSKIASLKQTITEATAGIKTLEMEIADLKTQAQRAKEDREMEKKEFEGVVADQRETQGLLQSALDVLKDVYGAGVVLVQTEQESRHHQAPPPGFSTYKKSTDSTGIIMLIEQLIADAKELEAKTTHDEEQAVKEYDEFVETNDASLKAKDDAIVTLTSQKATAKKDLAEAESELDGTLAELESLGNEAADLHKSCDYTIKNFDVRQEARDQEVNALREAKAYLSGMKS